MRSIIVTLLGAACLLLAGCTGSPSQNTSGTDACANTSASGSSYGAVEGGGGVADNTSTCDRTNMSRNDTSMANASNGTSS